jgi:hypothetical protein
MIDAATRLDRWFVYLNSLSWEPGELDRSAYFGFLRAESLSINRETAYAEILRRTRAVDAHARFYKLEHQQRLAAAHVGDKKWQPRDCPCPPPPPEPKFDPEALRAIAHRLPAACPDYLRSRSPIDPRQIDTATFLRTVFRSGEAVLIFDSYRSQGQLLWQYPGSQQRDALLRFRTGKTGGVWYLTNPIDGKWHFNPRQGCQSRRSQESITSYRHLVLESDVADRDDWIAYLCQLELPVLAICSTGSRAPHGLVLIDAPTKDAWGGFVRPHIPALVRVGACRGSLTGLRLSRLPGCRREEKRAWQELYYLNPNPRPRPICELEALR